MATVTDISKAQSSHYVLTRVPLPIAHLANEQVQFDDHRRGADGRPLMNALDVSFLDARSSNAMLSGGIDDLLEAQISCGMTGHNSRIWTAYGLVDTYFDAESAMTQRTTNIQTGSSLIL